MAKNRRLTQASVWRYLSKRYALQLSMQAKAGLKEVEMAGWASNEIALKTALEETANWVTDQALYHYAREVAKRVCQEYGLPSRWQGLLMAVAEKVVANYFVDPKGETLANLAWDMTRKLSLYSPTFATGIPPFVIHVAKAKAPIVISEVVRKVIIEAGALLGVPKSTVGGALSSSALKIT